MFLACSDSPTCAQYHSSSTSIEGKVGMLPYFRFCGADLVDVGCTYVCIAANLIGVQIPQGTESHIMFVQMNDCQCSSFS